MLRLRFLALACFAMLSVGSARAETSVTSQVPSVSTTSSSAAMPMIINSGAAAQTASTEDDGKPHIALPAAAAVNNDTESGSASESTKPSTDTVAAKPAPAPEPEPTLKASIDLAKQTMVVAENGSVKYTWPISSGTAEFPTPRGTFRPEWTSKMWYSRKYDNAPMPNAVFINGGVAVHATFHTGSLGRPASHGCIRLAPTNAKTFYGLVQKHGLKMTRVSIYGKPKWNAPEVASRRDDTRPRRYAEREQGSSNSWFWEKPKYRSASAYDPGFTNRQYRQVPRGYAYANSPRRQAYYLTDDGRRIVYVQRPQRRPYYYRSNSYAYGSGW